MWQDYKELRYKPGDKTVNGILYHSTGFIFLRDNEWVFEFMSDEGKVIYLV